ncbi:UDP-3-0-acyl N-acetylglucosamine deacetylase [Thermocrinis albus DSM 14484]|uniref:UDP-3-O-acyl-N-acetylglucosamine deacetylase n=1 Tax=Thermocrinis albus (strain DSM 14484 / JCM 11386 / HI 11/12) TaxID=638303 RepID=D3SQ92_THEAH|nr:UDP-3-O-acyl-N-acetylglucosamine deacetylase [Thermocrinis albus]ADC89329.1 UDP-3-0-acyl N-acetylglucosamine deacetylase [Thermocrinis albus DSM 14484]
MRQRTIKESIVFEGVGLHTGEHCKILLHPEKENTGVRFLVKGKYIPALYTHVVSTDHSTDLGDGSREVKTVEHLMAVLYLLGIDNVTVEVQKGQEVPAMDGSGFYFYKHLKTAVVDLNADKKVLYVKRIIRVDNCCASVWVQPDEDFRAVYVGYLEGFFDERSVEFDGNIRDIVFARTFCYDHHLPLLRRKGLARGGSLKNAVLLGKGFVYNREGLRSEDEPLRHKLLDLIGDVALIGRRLIGKVVSVRGGHTLNHQLLLELSRCL